MSTGIRPSKVRLEFDKNEEEEKKKKDGGALGPIVAQRMRSSIQEVPKDFPKDKRYVRKTRGACTQLKKTRIITRKSSELRVLDSLCRPPLIVGIDPH